MRPANLHKTEHLVKSLKNGCEKCYTELYNFFYPKIINTAKKFGIEEEDAREMAQDIFLNVWKNRENLKPELSFNAYLLTVLKSKIYHQAKKEVRKSKYVKYALKQQGITVNTTENQIEYEELEIISQAVIDNLPKQQKEIFFMRSIKHVSSGEISEHLGLSKRTVENHFYLASKTIKNELEKRFRLPLKPLHVEIAFLILLPCLY
ncbi:sigma-70 family RNA polymerase sigma factor [Cecembia calidifontis]|jgi:RNA polymerase sigma-70 factor (ECF subfamily)|uniref:RNA polymerase sigma-70 factor (ECF subfamily) n=1 Tax=Cecembia calidifontis TaxID=1187080 RepID=A0A4Q7PBC6_9BACT|nr:sigma-70 family RNA polymerase sigma factor [Cecembia calidifontis]RZS97505.1 RNA polymerase sigma-70 factor (ECF subfamily) [Cecembia calidifontis]